MRILAIPAAVLLAVSSAWALQPDRAKVHDEAQAWQIGWPMVHGPYSNFQPLNAAVPIADDLAQARVLWESADRDFGSAKTGSQTFKSARDILDRVGPRAKVHPGNWAGVIMAEGKVFASSFRPAGELFSATFKETPIQFQLDAEDLVIALDARTGKPAWKAAEPGGLVLSGGKRGGFQVAPAYHDGKVFAMGTTGRLFAYKAGDGTRLWQADIGAAHKAAAKEREAALAAGAAGKWVEPDGPGWHASLVVADGVLVVPTYSGSSYGRDTTIRGVDVNTGETKWEVKDATSRWATPAVWRHGDREYILTANLAGVLRLIDPRDGKELWKVGGLGPHYFTLSPSATHVLVNVAKIDDPKAKRVPGFYGAYRITPEGATKAWELPREEKYQIPTWFDTCARMRYTIRDSRVYVATDGTKEQPGAFLLIDEATGKILAEKTNRGPDNDQLTGLMYVLPDRVLNRTDSVHGSTRGGRKPIMQWRVGPGKVERMDDEVGLSGLDAAEFTNAYEVYMEAPIVAGLMVERTQHGTLVCYDLRKPDAATWSLAFANGYIGTPELPVRLWVKPDGTLHGGKAYPPTDRQAGLIYGQLRRYPQWERIDTTDARLAGDSLKATLKVGFGTHTWPTEVNLTRKGDAIEGTWSRNIPALENVHEVQGTLKGQGPLKDRLYPTPWLPQSPMTNLGKNADGTVTYILQLPEAIPGKSKGAELTVSLDYDGKQITRAAATAFGANTSWHEVDASGVKIADGKLEGTLMVVVNPDIWVAHNAAAKLGAAAKIDFTAAPAPDGTLTGSFTSRFGVPWKAGGKVSGSVKK